MVRFQRGGQSSQLESIFHAKTHQLTYEFRFLEVKIRHQCRVGQFSIRPRRFEQVSWLASVTWTPLGGSGARLSWTSLL